MQGVPVKLNLLGLISITTALLNGCAGPQFREDPKSTPVVPIALVINSLKCGISNALILDTGHRSGLLYATASVKLDVNVVTGRAVDGSISAGIPISGGAGTFTPSFSASNESTLTNNTSTEFDISISEPNTVTCQALNEKFTDAGFSIWLGQIVGDINRAIAGPPYASMKKYTYDSNFVVKADAKGGFNFELVPVKLGASFDASRSDVQHILITIEAVHKEKTGKITAKGPDFNIKSGGKPFQRKPVSK